ncbi:hypothetical protein A2U01_0064877, partial [Trifolium medium]|nr:hypothetical protein [Trifolium medium]
CGGVSSLGGCVVFVLLVWYGWFWELRSSKGVIFC